MTTLLRLFMVLLALSFAAFGKTVVLAPGSTPSQALGSLAQVPKFQWTNMATRQVYQASSWNDKVWGSMPAGEYELVELDPGASISLVQTETASLAAPKRKATPSKPVDSPSPAQSSSAPAPRVESGRTTTNFEEVTELVPGTNPGDVPIATVKRVPKKAPVQTRILPNYPASAEKPDEEFPELAELKKTDPAKYEQVASDARAMCAGFNPPSVQTKEGVTVKCKQQVTEARVHQTETIADHSEKKAREVNEWKRKLVLTAGVFLICLIIPFFCYFVYKVREDRKKIERPGKIRHVYAWSGAKEVADLAKQLPRRQEPIAPTSPSTTTVFPLEEPVVQLVPEAKQLSEFLENETRSHHNWEQIALYLKNTNCSLHCKVKTTIFKSGVALDVKAERATRQNLERTTAKYLAEKFPPCAIHYIGEVEGWHSYFVLLRSDLEHLLKLSPSDEFDQAVARVATYRDTNRQYGWSEMCGMASFLLRGIPTEITGHSNGLEVEAPQMYGGYVSTALNRILEHADACSIVMMDPKDGKTSFVIVPEIDAQSLRNEQQALRFAAMLS